MQHLAETQRDQDLVGAERIGYCDGCGLHDHHLRAELCPKCRKRVLAMDWSADDALGAEADVSAAMTVLRGAAA